MRGKHVDPISDDEAGGISDRAENARLLQNYIRDITAHQRRAEVRYLGKIRSTTRKLLANVHVNPTKDTDRR
jgi:hypothetical protein